MFHRVKNPNSLKYSNSELGALNICSYTHLSLELEVPSTRTNEAAPAALHNSQALRNSLPEFKFDLT